MAKQTRNWLSAAEACLKLGISFPTLKRYIADGKIQASQMVPKGKLRIPVASVEALLAEWAGK